MPRITVPIICNVTKDDEESQVKALFERLDLPIEQSDVTEVRVGRLYTEHIVCYYPSDTTGETIVETTRLALAVPLSIEEFEKLIDAVS